MQGWFRNSLMQRAAVESWGAAILTFFQCQFVDNKHRGGTRTGGAVHSRGAAVLTISFCWFIGNTAPAGHGGALYVTGAKMLAISSSSFEQNGYPQDLKVLRDGTGSISGGALCVIETVTVSISLCTFDSNRAVKGGALFAQLISDLQISESTFQKNSAEETGGAVHAHFTGPPTDKVDISACNFSQNRQLVSAARLNGAPPGGGSLFFTSRDSGCPEGYSCKQTVLSNTCDTSHGVWCRIKQKGNPVLSLRYWKCPIGCRKSLGMPELLPAPPAEFPPANSSVCVRGSELCEVKTGMRITISTSTFAIGSAYNGAAIVVVLPSKTRAHAHVRTRTRMRARTHARTRTHTHTHTHTHTRTYAYHRRHRHRLRRHRPRRHRVLPPHHRRLFHHIFAHTAMDIAATAADLAATPPPPISPPPPSPPTHLRFLRRRLRCNTCAQ